MHVLKQSTAASILVGPVLDSTGAVYAGAVIGDFTLTKNGVSAAMAAAATATHDGNGHYILALTTGNTDTLGRAAIYCNKATYTMAVSRFTVLTAPTFDAIITNAAGAAGGLVTSDASNGAKLSVGTGAGQLNVASGKAPATLAAADVTGNVAVDLQTIKTQTITAAAGVTFPTSIASPTNITAGTITTVTNLTNAPTVGDLTAAMKTSVTTAATAATPTAAAVTGAVGSVTGSVGSVAGSVAGSVGSVTGSVGSVTGNVGGNVVGTVASVVSKTGYSLGATGLDSITVTDPAGVASTFPQMVVQTWRRFFKKSSKNVGTGNIVTYKDDNLTAETTQAYTDDGAGNVTLGASA